MNKPGYAAFRVTHIGDEVMFTDCSGDASPCTNGQVGTRDDGHSWRKWLTSSTGMINRILTFILVDQVVEIDFKAGGELWGCVRWCFCAATAAFILSVLQLRLCASAKRHGF
jgi:hypothetical protein